MITSAILLGYAVVYAVSVFGLLGKLKWAPPLVIVVSVVNRALAFGVIFEPNVAWVVWSACKFVIIVLTFYLWRKK
jgi:lipoprotein signal peptidase